MELKQANKCFMPVPVCKGVGVWVFLFVFQPSVSLQYAGTVPRSVGEVARGIQAGRQDALLSSLSSVQPMTVSPLRADIVSGPVEVTWVGAEAEAGQQMTAVCVCDSIVMCLCLPFTLVLSWVLPD